MIINELLERKGMTKYKLSKQSGVPHATISDICSGKARLEKCSALTLYKIAKVLEVSVDFLLEESMKENGMTERPSFDVFKSNICHYVKDKGDIQFIIETLERDEIGALFRQKWYLESFYLLGMVDYLSRINDIPLCTNYNDIRSCRLEHAVYPSGAVLSDAAFGTEQYKRDCLAHAIPEFLNFNIVESEIRDVY